MPNTDLPNTDPSSTDLPNTDPSSTDPSSTDLPQRLPEHPDLEHLRKQAKRLLREALGGDDGALELADRHGMPDVRRLADAQLVIARVYGFASWPRLRAHVEAVTLHSRSPRKHVSGDEPLAARFVRLACLSYADDRADDVDPAAALLRANPGLSSTDIWTASAAGDVRAVERYLAAEPALLERPGGPYDWPPLLYACYSRLDLPGHSTLEVARHLLEQGADSNAGYLWHGLPSPFTALTGAFGGGEDNQNQPAHPQWDVLARLLLEAGADPNDSQALYNLQFTRSDAPLRLLLEHGLGRGDGGPWHARLGHTHQSPAELLADQLRWATRTGRTARAELLLRHGADPDALGTFADRRSTYEIAVLSGRSEIAELLLAYGATRPELTPVHRLLAAAMDADRPAVDALLATDAALLELAREEAPAAVLQAAVSNRLDAVRLLVGLGFAVSYRERITALHEAVSEDRLPLVSLLVELGADLGVRDTEFDGTPLDWARYLRKPEALVLLEAAGARE